MDARGQASEHRGATAGGGHNVGDDPSFTQEMYRRIEELRPIRKRYLEKLVNRGDLSLEEGEQHLKEFRERLDRIFDEIRMHPHLGFSLPRRRTSSRSSGSTGGRPRRRRRKVHSLLTSSRCHRRSVWGVTRNEDHRSLGSNRLAAARSTLSLRWRSGRLMVRRSTAN
jgi:hypothetical protein